MLDGSLILACFIVHTDEECLFFFFFNWSIIKFYVGKSIFFPLFIKNSILEKDLIKMLTFYFEKVSLGVRTSLLEAPPPLNSNPNLIKHRCAVCKVIVQPYCFKHGSTGMMRQKNASHKSKQLASSVELRRVVQTALQGGSEESWYDFYSFSCK